MYVRAARNRDELWLLDRIEELGVDEAAFRSRDYVIAVDEETNEKAGFGRIRVHKTGDGEYCELTGVGVLEDWRGQGVGTHVVERLVENADDEGFETLYTFVENPEFYERLGFEPIAEADLPDALADRLAEKREGVAPEATPLRLTVDQFVVPREERELFKQAGGAEPGGESEVEETAEDFGIDPDEATYKYDTSG